MATAANHMSKRKRARCGAEYPAEALALAERIGVESIHGVADAPRCPAPSRFRIHRSGV